MIKTLVLLTIGCLVLNISCSRNNHKKTNTKILESPYSLRVVTEVNDDAIDVVYFVSNISYKNALMFKNPSTYLHVFGDSTLEIKHTSQCHRNTIDVKNCNLKSYDTSMFLNLKSYDEFRISGKVVILGLSSVKSIGMKYIATIRFPFELNYLCKNVWSGYIYYLGYLD